MHLSKIISAKIRYDKVLKGVNLKSYWEWYPSKADFTVDWVIGLVPGNIIASPSGWVRLVKGQESIRPWICLFTWQHSLVNGRFKAVHTDMAISPRVISRHTCTYTGVIEMLEQPYFPYLSVGNFTRACKKYFSDNLTVVFSSFTLNI